MSTIKGRTALFMDGANLYATTKALGLEIDYKKLLKYFSERYDLVRASYYTAVVEDQEYSSIRPLIDWLDYNGYTVVTKAAKKFTGSDGREKIKGNMDVEMVVDALEMAPFVQNIILFTGDGDFRAMIVGLQKKGVRVIVVSSIKCEPPMLADELRRQADEFIDMRAIEQHIARGERTKGPTNVEPH